MKIHYGGGELDLFAVTIKWKRYLNRYIRAHIFGRVLEVGAGKGANTLVHLSDRVSEWTCLEPDPRLCREIEGTGQPGVRVLNGIIHDVHPSDCYDCILYIDVLEHIEDDIAEIREAAKRLKSGGILLVASPAHQFLYSPFDAQIGHYRRYSRRSIKRVLPDDCVIVDNLYLDSAGLLLSLGNKILLGQSMPTPTQLRVWDRLFVPLSQITDRLFLNRIGKTVLFIMRKN